jgi:FAD/FMN-containing dehydrogenase
VRRACARGRAGGYGHAGDGNLHFNISFPKEMQATQVAELEPIVRRAIHDLVAAHGGSFSAEHGIGRLKVGALERYSSPVTLAMMREIKRALDPNGIMNPGKLLAAASTS